jgi:hypothetical protein
VSCPAQLAPHVHLTPNKDDLLPKAPRGAHGPFYIYAGRAIASHGIQCYAHDLLPVIWR